jgi:cytochrome P450
MFALTRYHSVLRALNDANAFSSASGVMMNDDMNQVLRGNTLCSDGAQHLRSRRLIGKPLGPAALKSLRDEIAWKAERLVDGLVAKRLFCAIADLATFLPVDMQIDWSARSKPQAFDRR